MRLRSATFRTSTLLLVLLLFAASVRAQVGTGSCADQARLVKETPYGSFYKTKLKGGYSIRYGYQCDEDNQYLLYCKGNRVIDTLSGMGIGISYHTLGYVYADFDRYFVFVNRFGGGYPGNPVMVAVYEKTHMKSLLPTSASLVDLSDKAGLLFYCEGTGADEGDPFVMLDMATMKTKEYVFPKHFRGPGMTNRFRLEKVNATTVTFSYDVDGVEKTKTYKR